MLFQVIIPKKLSSEAESLFQQLSEQEKEIDQEGFNMRFGYKYKTRPPKKMRKEKYKGQLRKDKYRDVDYEYDEDDTEAKLSGKERYYDQDDIEEVYEEVINKRSSYKNKNKY